MPHLKLEGLPGADAVLARLAPFTVKDETGVQKALAFYREREGRQILVEALVADGPRPRHFFVSLADRDGAWLLRCLPATDPEKTPAVKRLLVRLALRLRDAFPGAAVATTNLNEELAALDDGGPPPSRA